MSKVTIYHNPKCGTSRNTLAMIKESGVEVEVVEYLKTPPTQETIVGLIDLMKVEVRDILRQRGTPYDALGLGDEYLTDEVLIDAIVANPILMNRPIVVTPKGAKLCRPSELVFDLLENETKTAFIKEDGEVVKPPSA